MDKQRFLLSIGKSLLRFFVLALVLTYGLSQVTEYNTLKSIVADVTAKMIGRNQTMSDASQEIKEGIVQQCKSTDKITVSLGYENVTVDCKEVRAKGDFSLSQFTADVALKDYYKDYGCSPVGCVATLVMDRKSEDIPYIFSAQMNQFLKTLVLYLAAGIALSMFIIIYSLREVFPISKEIGRTLLSAGIPFLVLVLLFYREQLLVSTGILSGKEDLMRSIDGFLSGPIYNVVNLYLYMYGIAFAVGAVLAAIGYIGTRKRTTEAKKGELTGSQ